MWPKKNCPANAFTLIHLFHWLRGNLGASSSELVCRFSLRAGWPLSLGPICVTIVIEQSPSLFANLVFPVGCRRARERARVLLQRRGAPVGVWTHHKSNFNFLELQLSGFLLKGMFTVCRPAPALLSALACRRASLLGVEMECGCWLNWIWSVWWINSCNGHFACNMIRRRASLRVWACHGGAIFGL